jgi:uncharacterized protein (TIGR02217 family)
MAFHNLQFPVGIAEGAEGGPEFSTAVVVSSGGYEQRVANWATARRRWNVATALLDSSDYVTLYSFFLACQGRLNAFRFKDWSDYELARQTIGTTDGSDATWQLFKNYTSGATTTARNITRPVSGTVRVWVDNVERTLGSGGTEFQVNVGTGVITLGTTLAALSAKAIEASCQFDVPARFDIDHWPLSLKSYQIGEVGDIPVVEIRE